MRDRSKKKNKNNIIVLTRLDKKTRMKLEDTCRRLEIRKSSVIRELIKSWLKSPSRQQEYKDMLEHASDKKPTKSKTARNKPQRYKDDEWEFVEDIRLPEEMDFTM